MKVYLGSEGIASHVHNLGTRWRRVVNFTHQPLYPQRKSPQYPMDRRQGGPQSQSGHGGEDKKKTIIIHARN
jgi:hypothetical protein